MIFLLLSLFTISLVFLSFYTRVKRYIVILSFQGVLLMFIAILLLGKLNILHLLFILLETFVVKAIFIPLFLNYLRKRNNLKNTSQSRINPFYSVLIITFAIIICFFIINVISSDSLYKEIFAVSLICMITGLLFIITHLNIFTHIVGYVVFENGVFLLSLAVGNEMPVMVNLSIMMDIFIGVLVLGIFLNKIGDKYNQVEVNDLLTELVD